MKREGVGAPGVHDSKHVDGSQRTPVRQVASAPVAHGKVRASSASGGSASGMAAMRDHIEIISLHVVNFLPEIHVVLLVFDFLAEDNRVRRFFDRAGGHTVSGL